MTPAAHRAKAERIRRTLAKLRPSDYEMCIDGAMLAANHYVNMALHVLGIRPDDRDVIHTEFLDVIDYRRFEVAAKALVEAIEAIEELRAPFVRGAAPDGIAAGERALQQLARVEAEALRARPLAFPLLKYTPEP